MSGDVLQLDVEAWEELVKASAPASPFLAALDLEVLLARDVAVSDRMLQDRWGMSRRKVRELRGQRPAAERFVKVRSMIAELAAPAELVPSGALLLDPDSTRLSSADHAWIDAALDDRPAPDVLVEQLVEALEQADEIPRSWDALLRKVKAAHANGAIPRRYSWPEVEAALWSATRRVAPELVRR